MQAQTDPFGAKATLTVDGLTTGYYRLDALASRGFPGVDRLPFTLKILLENLLRRFDGHVYTEGDVRLLAGWNPQTSVVKEFPFLLSRVILTTSESAMDVFSVRFTVTRS